MKLIFRSCQKFLHKRFILCFLFRLWTAQKLFSFTIFVFFKIQSKMNNISLYYLSYAPTTPYLQLLNDIQYLITFTTTYETVIMLTVFPFLFLLYLLIVFIIFKNPNQFRNSYYTLVVGLAVSDFAMLLYTIYAFIYDVVGFPYFGRVVDATFSFVLYFVLGWYSTQIYSVLLATNRFFAIVFFLLYKKTFSVKISLIWIIFCILLSFSLACPMWLYVQFLYIPKYKVGIFYPYTFSGLFTGEYYTLRKCDEYFSYIVACYIMALYIFCVLYSMVKVKSFQSSSRSSYVKEMKMLFQGLTIGILLCSLSFMHWFTPPATLNRMGTWLYCALNPVIYLVFDGTLRKLFFKQLTSIKISTNSNTV